MINITREEIKKTTEESRHSEKKRKMTLIRGFRDKELPSAMFNSLQLGTYVRPHKHVSNRGKEILIANEGELLAIFFDEKGNITYSTIISLSKTNYLEIPPQTYHTVIALKPDTVLCEIYLETHENDEEYKKFAPWSPEEKSKESEEYLSNLTKEALSLAD